MMILKQSFWKDKRDKRVGKAGRGREAFEFGFVVGDEEEVYKKRTSSFNLYKSVRPDLSQFSDASGTHVRPLLSPILYVVGPEIRSTRPQVPAQPRSGVRAQCWEGPGRSTGPTSTAGSDTLAQMLRR